MKTEGYSGPTGGKHEPRTGDQECGMKALRLRSRWDILHLFIHAGLGLCQPELGPVVPLAELFFTGSKLLRFSVKKTRELRMDAKLLSSGNEYNIRHGSWEREKNGQGSGSEDSLWRRMPLSDVGWDL